MEAVCEKDEKGTTEDEMVGWHHRLNGHECEQALGVGDGQGARCAAVHGVITICSDFGSSPKIKSATVSTVSPSVCHEVMGLNAMILVF